MSLIYNAKFDKNTRKLSFEDKAGNEIYSFIVPERGPAVDDITKPLTFKATQDGSTVKLAKRGSLSDRFIVSWNGGKNWEDYSIGTVITLNTGDEVSFRTSADRTSAQSFYDYFYFEMTGKIEAWHNVMSMTNADFPVQEISIHYAFYELFKDCTSLTKAPILPAITLTPQCYRDMFNGCTSLVKAPELPATTLTIYCYAGMFNGCTSLVDAPVLPVTTLDEYCYFWMFSNCTSLVKAPELRATTLASNCYTSMFYGCSSLNEVHCYIPPTISEEDIPTYTGDGSNASMEQWLKGVSPTGTFYTNEDANWPSDPSGIPTGWNRVPAVDDITKPLTFKATQDGSTVTLKKNGSPTGDFQTSRDGGNTWTDYTIDTAITLNTGDEVSFRTSADRTSAQTSQDYFGFQMTGKIWARHNVMSLYRTNDFATYNTVVEYAFTQLFLNCTSLTKAPALPATTLANGCYSNIFFGCTSLTKAPVLPATTLAPFCYGNMFRGCTSLTKAPVLPATTLADNCYSGMFNGCTSLTKAPELPATTLAQQCYYQMFSGCTSLTKSPVLPATTLPQYCYSNMFNGCSSLNEVRCQMSSSYNSSQISLYTQNWLSGVSSTGTFYTNADANWPSGESGIPTGWRRVNDEAPAFDDIAKPLMFRATQDGAVRLNAKGSPDGAFETSRDDGNTWEDYTLGTSIALNTSDRVSFRAKSDRTSGQSSSNYFYFEMSGKIEAWHNVMSLYSTNDFATDSTAIRSAFYKMFMNCTSLTKAPSLPATTLVERCYSGMFNGCTSLTKAPELPATTLAQYCYLNMFKSCTSLTKAPELTATTLANNCYQYMFDGCSSLNEVHCNMPSSYSSSQISSTYASNWLSGVSSTGTFYTNADANWPSGASGIPTGWNRVNEETPAVDDITKPLTFRATQDGSTVTLNWTISPVNFQTSRDGGNTWEDYTLVHAITLNIGEEVSFRAKANRTSKQSSDDYFYFEMTGKIEAWHNVMSVYRKIDFATFNAVVSYSFYKMFNGCTSLTKAPALPATKLANNCYDHMFNGCTSLTEAPALPATTLANYCYDNMFNGCTSLTKAPELTATTIASYCYDNMFNGCTSLTKAPALPATTLAKYCYSGMFNGCTSLTEAPELPATTLDMDCYISMFYGCTSLTKAPALPATTLANYCYQHMFYGCTSLTEAPELPATTLSNKCYDNMFRGCTSLTKAPELPATTLATFCYRTMFGNCTSLTEAPALPATTLADYCYQYMFSGCTSLTKAPALPATTLASECYKSMFSGCSSLNEVRCKMSSSYSSSQISSYAYNWLSNVSPTGTFYTNADANWPSGDDGIPQTWTRANIDDYPTT